MLVVDHLVIAEWGYPHMGQTCVRQCDISVPKHVQVLADCHQLGLVHGDIKPENVMSLKEKDGVRLVDFGTASVLAGRHPSKYPFSASMPALWILK
jgi:serine/threonine protein kinase